MAQESTIICVDNSEWMRNGDLPPTRFNCQQEAVRALIHYKLRSNPENSVGLLSLANRVEVLNSCLTDDRKLMVRLHSLEINGTAQIVAGIKTAFLALKHRKNKNHKQRVIIFIGSPLDQLVEEKDMFLKFAKKLKKEKVNVDFVLFGEATSEKNQIVVEFVNTLNGTGNDDGGSHLLVVPVGDTKLYDALLHSPICEGVANGGGGMGAGGDFGMDEDDPELAMALRISLEEQRLRQQQPQQGGGDGEQPAVGGGGAPMDVDHPPAGGATATPAVRPPTPTATQPPSNFAEMTEEEQMAYALRLSMMQEGGQQDAQQGPPPIAGGSRSPSMAMSTPAPTPMETEESGIDAVGDLLNDPARLQQLVDQQGQQQPSSGAETKGTKKPVKKEEDGSGEQKDDK